MFRIRRIYDDLLPVNQDALAQVQGILSDHFPGRYQEEFDGIPEKLRNPFKQRFRTHLLVAENHRRRVLGVAMLMYDPEIRFVYLDWLATARKHAGGGIGGVLYERVRREAMALGARGLFFECLPDEAAGCPDDTLLAENRARLRFYEQFGARPVVNTGYELPIREGDTCMPHLVCDDLGRSDALGRSFVRKMVRAVLERKYRGYCPPDYVERVIRSIQDDPVRLRAYRYRKGAAVKPESVDAAGEGVALVVSGKHALHHVHEKGYVEAPVRIDVILRHLEPSGLFDRVRPRPFADEHLLAVHDRELVDYLKQAAASLPAGKTLYPYVFPIRNRTRPPSDPSVLSGYYCLDTFTPIHADVYHVARNGVDCALTAAREVLEGRRLAYALIRPPGHHAETRFFGGFCYFNNTAVAAAYLARLGRVAILDIDYHHGNGQQEIFYNSARVLTVSIHGDPSFAYPYFSGFEDETGEGDGEGFNLNLPLPESVNGQGYREALDRAITRIRDFSPLFLVVALGADTGKGDPTGTWQLGARDFEANGRRIGAAGFPVAVIQEGGYRTRTLGTNLLAFFQGLARGCRDAERTSPREKTSTSPIRYRDTVKDQDALAIRRLVAATGFFSDEEIDVAEELALERFHRGPASGYHFVLAEQGETLAGYACFGPVPCTHSSFDLYWIAVHPGFQGKGVGRALLSRVKESVRKMGGERLYAETSERPSYAPTRGFYEQNGFSIEAVLGDYYAPGEGMVIYRLPVGSES